VEELVWSGSDSRLVADISADRAGSMSDYTIVGWLDVKRVLRMVQPFVIFKREQVERGLELLSRLESTESPAEFVESAKLVDAFATLNYSKRKVIDAACVETYLNGMGLLVPVTTEGLVSRPEIADDCHVRTWQIQRDDHTPAPRKRMKI
jgi:hypothetical protein